MNKRIVAGLAALLMCASALPLPEIAQSFPFGISVMTVDALQQSADVGEGLKAVYVEPIEATQTAPAQKAKLTLTIDRNYMAKYFDPSVSELHIDMTEQVNAAVEAIRTAFYSNKNNSDKTLNIDLSDADIILNASFTTQAYPNLAYVYFEDSYINQIGSGMFQNMNNLQYADFGDTITTIGANAFSGCTNSFAGSQNNNTLELGNVQYIGDNAFQNCKQLEHINFNKSTKTIGRSAFTNCTGLKDVELPSSIETIGDSAFSGNTACSSIKFANNSSEESVGRNAFASNTALRTIDFGTGTKITSFGDNCFASNTSLMYVYADGKSNTLPQGIDHQQLGMSLFSGCTSLQSFIWPAYLEILPGSTFNGCTALQSVIFGDETGSTSVCETIGQSAFQKCTSLNELVLPQSATTIGQSAFQDCSLLQKLVVSDNLDRLGGVYSFRFNNNDKTYEFISTLTADPIGADLKNYKEGSVFAACPLISIYPRSEMSKADANFIDYANKIKLPDSVKALPQKCFWNCTGIKEVTLGNSIDSVGSDSFNSCTSLVTASLPESVKVLTKNVFLNCKLLKDVVVSSQLSSVYDSAFSGCESLETITPSNLAVLPYTVQFPATCGGVNNNAFNGCKSIKFINILTDSKGTTNFKTLGSGAFKDCKNLSGSNYGGTPTDTISLPSGLLVVQSSAFENCSSLVNMVLEGNVTSIGELAFSGCESMVRITVNPTLKQIGNSAFKNCKALKNPPQTADGKNALNQLTKINDSTFENCLSLENIVIPKSIASVGASAFKGCTELRSVLVENGSALYEINANAFQNCTSLALFSGTDKKNGISYFPDSIITIKSMAFDNTGLTNIKIIKPASSGSMNVIEKNAFSNNKVLEKADLSEANMIRLEDSLFQNCTQLKTVVLPDSTISSIGQNAFNGCNYLHTFGDKNTPEGEYVIPESVISIGNNAFTNNYCMQKITFPSKTSNIDLTMFNFNIREQDIIDKGYTPIEAIVVNPSNVNYTSIDGVLFDKEAKKLLVYPYRKEGDTYKIPSTVTAIDDSAFGSSRYLKEMEIPTTVTSIAQKAFYNCYQLEKVNFGENDSVTIGQNAVTTQLPGNVLTFYGMTPSTAETYATQNRINFVPLNASGLELKVTFNTTDTQLVTDAMISFDDADKTTTHTADGVFEFPLLKDGTYKMTVSAKNFAPRTYDITVKDHVIEDPNITLNLLGDITGDKKLNAADLLKAKSHIKGVAKLEGYEFNCADIDGNNTINAADLLKMKSHIKGVSKLW